MQIKEKIETIYKAESANVLATLLRLFGNLDHAEEALQIAFQVALEKWPITGIPQNPTSWLISTGRFKMIDQLRKHDRHHRIEREITPETSTELTDIEIDPVQIEDDQLRLMFYCCHPDIPIDSRIALALRDVCGLKTEAIAKAYLISSEAVKKRISRAKSVFKNQNISLDLPSKTELANRINAVLHVIYLIYNEGYAASSGDERIRKDLTDEAVYLSRKMNHLLPVPEGIGLLALMLIQDARCDTRMTESGELIPLEDQDRSLWNQDLINEANGYIQQAILSGRMGPYTIQAAIASLHAEADSIENTRWDLVIQYYDMLLLIQPAPIIQLNRAIAIGQYKGSFEALELLESLQQDNALKHHHLLYAAKAKFYQQNQDIENALKAYQIAIDLAPQKSEREYLKKERSKLI